MSYTFTNYAGIPAQEYKPVLSDIIGNILGGYQEGTKAGYLQPTLEEQLKKSKLYNQYYGPNMESQMGLRGAQAGHLGSLTTGQNITNRYLPKKLQAEIESLNASAQKARLVKMIREQLLGGSQGSQPAAMNQSQGENATPLFQGQGMSQAPMQQVAEQMSQMQSNQPVAQTMNKTNANLPLGGNYAKAAIASQMLGLGAPKIVDLNGKQVAITPFGNFDTGAQGLSARDKQVAVQDAKKIASLEEKALTGYQKLETFNELNEDLGSKEFEALRQHPILGKHELGWYKKFGTKEQQAMIGRVETHMGSIIKDAASDFKGQFRIGEQALLNSMKPNIGDSLDVMKGKAEALTYMTSLLTKRAEMEADLMRNYNISVLQAKKISDKQINPKAIKKEIQTLLHPSPNAGKYNIEGLLAEKARRDAMRIKNG